MLLYIIIAVFVLISVLLIAVKQARFILSLVCLSIGAYFVIDVMTGKSPVAGDYKVERIEFDSCLHDQSAGAIVLEAGDRKYFLYEDLIKNTSSLTDAAAVICNNEWATIWVRQNVLGATLVRGIDTPGFNVPVGTGLKLDDPVSNNFWGVFFLANGFFIFIFTIILGKEVVSHIRRKRT